MNTIGDNPYSSILKTMSENAVELQPVPFRMGKVINLSPIKILVNDTVQDKSTMKTLPDLMIALNDIVLLACVDNEQEFVILGKVVECNA